MSDVVQLADFLGTYVSVAELRNATNQEAYLRQFVVPDSAAAQLLDQTMGDPECLRKLIQLLVDPGERKMR